MQSENGFVGDLYGIIDGDGRRRGVGRSSAAVVVVYSPPLMAKPMFDLAVPPRDRVRRAYGIRMFPDRV